MTDHAAHPGNEFCDACRPIITADYAAGERFWKHWSTAWTGRADGVRIRFKVLSKRMANGRYACAFVGERSAGLPKAVYGRETFGTPAELDAFARGVESALRSAVHPELAFRAVDLGGYDTYAKLVHGVTEDPDLGDWKLEKGAPKPPA